MKEEEAEEIKEKDRIKDKRRPNKRRRMKTYYNTSVIMCREIYFFHLRQRGTAHTKHACTIRNDVSLQKRRSSDENHIWYL